jgi:EAL and modified HD-GYP domain-containing signal transduction protein
LSDAIELINPKTLVIEVLENVEVDDLLLKRIEELNKKGYKIALDDFSENLQSYPIVPIANIIKYDILITPLDKIEADVKDAIAKNKVVLAEKIETEQEYIKAKKMGFHLFQGYFFSKPQIIGGLRTRKTANTVYQRIMSELHSEEPSYQRLTDIVATDINMAYRVMRASGNESNKKTIKGALVKMGLRELERWVNVLMLQELSDNKPQELIKMSLVRSKFGELIAAHSKFSKRRYEISLMCLFSILDAMLDQTMEIALDGVDVSSDVKEVLIYHKGNLKPIYEMVIGYEQGTNILSNQKFVQIEVDQSKLFTWYLEAIAWAEDVMCSIR